MKFQHSFTTICLLALATASSFNPASANRSSAEPASAQTDSTALNQPQMIVQLGHSDLITSLAVSPDGRLIATASWDGSAILWDTATGKEIKRFKHPGRVEYVAFSPDSLRLFTGSGSGTRFWDVSTGREISLFKEHATGGELFTEYALSPDGRFILTGDWNNMVNLWDAAAGRSIFRLQFPGKISALTFSPDNRFALIGWSNGLFFSNRRDNKAAVTLLDLTTGREALRFDVSDTPSATAVAFSPDGRFAAAGVEGASNDGNPIGTALIWNIATGQEARRFTGHSGQIRSVAFSPGGVLATSDNDGMMRLWNISTGRKLLEFKGDPIAVTSSAFSPDGRVIITGGNSHSARMMDATTGEEIHRLAGMSSPVYAAGFSPNNRFIVTGIGLGDMESNAACLWELAAGSEARRFRHAVPVGSAIFSPDGSYLALAGLTEFPEKLMNAMTEAQMEARNVSVWNLDTGALVREFKTARAPVAFSPDGRNIAMREQGAMAKDMCVRNVATGRIVRRFADSADEVVIASVAYSPDGRFILTGDSGDMVSGVMQLWNAITGRSIRVFKPVDWQTEGESNFPKVRFSPDGRFILGGGRLWRTANGQVVRRFADASRKATSLSDTSGGGNLGAYSPDGRLIATDDAEEITLWDAATGREVRRLTGHLRYINSIDFSPDGRFIISGSEDGTARLWEVATGKERCRLVSFPNGDWVVVAPDGRFDTNNLEDIKGLHWMVPDDPLTPLPLEIFMRDYYEPRLLTRILNGETFGAIRNLADLNRVQPKIAITRIEPHPNSPDTVTVTVEVAGAKGVFQRNDKRMVLETGVHDLRLFRDRQMVGHAPRAGATARPSASDGDDELSAWRTDTEIKMDSTGKAVVRFENIKLPRNRTSDQVEFSAYAFNLDRVKSATDRKSFRLPAGLTPRKGRAYIISVGVNAHENAKFDLRYAANDARRLQSALSDELSAVGEYEKIVRVPLISDYKMEGDNRVMTESLATKSNIRAALDLLSGRSVDAELLKGIPNANELQRARPEDMVIISFASHGYADRKGNFYIVPSDTGEGEVKKVTEEFLSRCISSEELSLWLRDVDAGEMVMIVDACQSAAAVQGEGFKPGPMGSRGLGQLSYDKGMRIIAATQADNVALENKELEQGLLTYALIKRGIEEGKADHSPADKKITVKEWLLFGVKQVPDLYNDIKQGKLRLLVHGEGSASKVQQPSLFDFTKKKIEVILATRN